MWLVGLATLVGLMTSVGVVRGCAVVARHRAGSAADLAALAGAVSAQQTAGGVEPCGLAARIAGRNGARLASCLRTGDDVEVVVTRRLVLGRLGRWQAIARARAGPADRSWSPP